MDTHTNTNLPQTMTVKQKIFCLEYLRDFNATRAAKAAGYSDKTAHATGSENLRKPQIQDFLSRVMSGKLQALDLEVDTVLREWKLIAFADIGDYIQVYDDGSTVRLDFSKIREIATPPRHGPAPPAPVLPAPVPPPPAALSAVGS